MATEEELHGLARVQIALAKMDGHKIDKKQARFNDIVAVAMAYPLMGHASQFDGMREAIDACIVGDPMHVEGGSVLTLAPAWMICIQERPHGLAV